jgi:hypothetical protein
MHFKIHTILKIYFTRAGGVAQAVGAVPQKKKNIYIYI